MKPQGICPLRRGPNAIKELLGVCLLKVWKKKGKLGSSGVA